MHNAHCTMHIVQCTFPSTLYVVHWLDPHKCQLFFQVEQITKEQNYQRWNLSNKIMSNCPLFYSDTGRRDSGRLAKVPTRGCFGGMSYIIQPFCGGVCNNLSTISTITMHCIHNLHWHRLTLCWRTSSPLSHYQMGIIHFSGLLLRLESFL